MHPSRDHGEGKGGAPRLPSGMRVVCDEAWTNWRGQDA
jgi:hypothetical protein